VVRRYRSSEQQHCKKYLLEIKERGIKTSEFFEGRKASSSTISARRPGLDNLHIGESLFFLLKTL
jgi:hypothetical protein